MSARANARRGGNAALSALNAGMAADSVLGSWATVCSSAVFSRAKALAVVLKSVIRFSRFCGWASTAPATCALGGDVVGEVVGLDAERVVGDDRGVLVGGQPVLDGLVVRRAAQLDRLAVLLQQRLEVLAGVGLQPGEDLIELDGLDALLDREGVAVGATGASGVPGETSTKKLPSRKIRGRIAKVASSWIGRPWLVIVHRHVGRLARALGGAGRLAARLVRHRGDRADVDARDAHQRTRLQPVGVGEGRVDRVLVGERVGELRVGRVGEDGDQDDPDQAGLELAHAVAALLACVRNLMGSRGTLASWGPVVGLRLNVSPAGTRARPLNVGPWSPGVCASVPRLRPGGIEVVELERVAALAGLAVGVALVVDRRAVGLRVQVLVAAGQQRGRAAAVGGLRSRPAGRRCWAGSGCPG